MKKIRRKIKRLDLENWQKMVCEINDNDYVGMKEITPIINKNGCYLEENKCWFEYSGRAFTYNKEDFLYTLKILSMPNFSELQKKSLEDFIKYNKKIASKHQKEMLYMMKQEEDLKKAIRDIKKIKFKIKKIKKMKK